MFVITADQVASRTTEDLAGSAVRTLYQRYGDRLALPPDRNAGDEIQVLTTDADTVLEIVLDLTRDGRWSVGLGRGDVRRPLPPTTRAATGDAFIAARTAVVIAKRRPLRFAAVPDTDVDALIGLLVDLRSRRTAPGWEIYDLLRTGLSQQAAASQLGISASAVGARVKAAGIRIEEASGPALVRLLRRLDAGHSSENQE